MPADAAWARDVVAALWEQLPPRVRRRPRRADDHDGGDGSSEGEPAVCVGLLAPGLADDPTGASADWLPAPEGLVPTQVINPGLAADAAVYEAVLSALPGVRCVRVSAEPPAMPVSSPTAAAPTTPTPAPTPTAPTPLDACDWVIAFEHLGSADVVRRLRALRARGRLRAVALVANLEALDPVGARWAPTLAALSLVTHFVAKTPALVPVLERLRDERGSPHATVVLVGHCCPPPPAPPGRGWPPAAERRDVIHVAGCSPLKNTLENVRAGAALVMRNRPHLRRLIVRVTAKWGGAATSPARLTYALSPARLRALHELVRRLGDVAELSIGGYMPAQELAALYMRARVALCCSNAEGFGHTLLEAAAHGCLVVTTDGVPMSDVLAAGLRGGRERTVALAAPLAERAHQRYGGRWYRVVADQILHAAETLPLRTYDDATVARCVDVFRWRQRCVVRGVAELVDDVAEDRP